MLTFALVVQFATHALPIQAVEPAVAIDHPAEAGDSAVATGTVVQMPAGSGGRTSRSGARDAKAPRPAASVTKGTRAGRAELGEEEPGLDEGGDVRDPDAPVRVTIIGPDGEPRTKIIRRSGRDGVAAPARRSHE